MTSAVDLGPSAKRPDGQTAATDHGRTPRSKPFQHETDGWFQPSAPPRNTSHTKLRERLWPSDVIGSLLSKPWMETAVPVIILALVLLYFSIFFNGFMTGGNVGGVLRQTGEMGFVVLGMTLVVIVGGIDLSVGAIFALTNFTALLFVQLLGWPAPAAIVATILVGAALGAFNGVLIGFLRLRAFLTTLISLTKFRAMYDNLILRYGNAITSEFPDDEIWNFIAFGDVFGIGLAIWLCVIAAFFCHVLLTRLRPGWHILAIGGSRRSAHNAGVPVAWVVMCCYIASGALTAVSAIFFAARLGTLSGDVGSGLEFTILTAVVVGGISLGGGRGSVLKAALGLLIVLFIVNGLMSMSASGGIINFALATVLIVASVIDIVWNRNRSLQLGKSLFHPVLREGRPYPVARAGVSSPWRVNDRLAAAQTIDAGAKGVDDVIVADDGSMFVATRDGQITRYSTPASVSPQDTVHVGGRTLALALGPDGSLYGASAGMGIYRLSRDLSVTTLAVETRRSALSPVANGRLKFASGLVLLDDGSVYFTETSSRYDVSQDALDLLEGRSSGRLMRYDAASGKTATVLSGLWHPNGLALGPDGVSLMISLTGECAVKRYWFGGPRKGQIETVLADLPGYPDSISPASDGSYWLAIAGMRSPVLDLAMTMPDFRKRMTDRIPEDEWLAPQMNHGCVVRFGADGKIHETLWNGRDRMPASAVREHAGWLYVASARAGRLLRLRLPDATGGDEVDTLSLPEGADR